MLLELICLRKFVNWISDLYPAHHGCQFSHLTVHANKCTQRFQESFLMMRVESLTLQIASSLGRKTEHRAPWHKWWQVAVPLELDHKAPLDSKLYSRISSSLTVCKMNVPSQPLTEGSGLQSKLFKPSSLVAPLMASVSSPRKSMIGPWKGIAVIAVAIKTGGRLSLVAQLH